MPEAVPGNEVFSWKNHGRTISGKWSFWKLFFCNEWIERLFILFCRKRSKCVLKFFFIGNGREDVPVERLLFTDEYWIWLVGLQPSSGPPSRPPPPSSDSGIRNAESAPTSPTHSVVGQVVVSEEEVPSWRRPGSFRARHTTNGPSAISSSPSGKEGLNRSISQPLTSTATTPVTATVVSASSTSALAADTEVTLRRAHSFESDERYITFHIQLIQSYHYHTFSHPSDITASIHSLIHWFLLESRLGSRGGCTCNSPLFFFFSFCCTEHWINPFSIVGMQCNNPTVEKQNKNGANRKI